MEKENLKIIFEVDRDNLETEIKQLKEFDKVVFNAKLPLDVKKGIRNILSSEIESMKFSKNQIETDLNKILEVEVCGLSYEEEDYIIESQLEEYREKKENGI
jgi:hypothetical protein